MKLNKIMLVAGARPNFVKIAPIIKAFSESPAANKARLLLVHTGQHYDYKLSQVFFDDLAIPRPDLYLGVGSGSHTTQIAKVMLELEKVLVREKPDLLMVVGDVNSTVASALTAYKLQIPVAHVEAGLRSFDRTMPEEANRILTDQMSEFLFTPSRDAFDNLLREGIAGKKIFNVGNVMIDTLKSNLPKAIDRPILKKLGLDNEGKPGCYVLVTLHRPSNVDDAKVLGGIFRALRAISRELSLLYPVHPRSWANIVKFGFHDYFENVKSTSNIRQFSNCTRPGLYAIDPLGYLDFLKVQLHAAAVLTDSGGVQEETTFLGVPCLTLRENTERPITVDLGTNKVIGMNEEKIMQAWNEIKDNKNGNMKERHAGARRAGCKISKWDGKAAERIVRILFR